MIRFYRDGTRIWRWAFRLRWRWLRGLGIGVEHVPGPLAPDDPWIYSRVEVRILVVKLTVEHRRTWASPPDQPEGGR